jgi:hypothetical protein
LALKVDRRKDSRVLWVLTNHATVNSSHLASLAAGDLKEKVAKFMFKVSKSGNTLIQCSQKR